MSDGMHERITGPIEGHWFASYALPTPEGWIAYTKVSDHAPSDVWSCTAIDKVCADSFEPGAALDLAEARAIERSAAGAANPPAASAWSERAARMAMCWLQANRTPAS
jgi:hypothetical protein